MARGKGQPVEPEGSHASMAEGVDMYAATGIDVLSKIEEMGLALPQRPCKADGSPIEQMPLPPNLSSLSDEALGTLFTNLCIWQEYLMGLETVVEDELEVREEQKDFVKSKIWKETAGSVTEKDHSVRIDRRFVEANANWRKAKRLRAWVQTAVKIQQKSRDTVSRIITLRGDQTRAGNRSSNIGAGRGRAGGRWR